MTARRWLLTLLFCGVTLLTVQAQDEGSPAEAIAGLRRDLPLLELLVDEAIELANETDALGRAELANHLAERLTQELGAAIVMDDLPRVVELGRHIETTLMQAVAGNLCRARSGEMRQHDVERVQAQALRIGHTATYELSRLPRGTHAEIDRLIRALPETKARIDQAIKESTVAQPQ
jgi:hypothetical protein